MFALTPCKGAEKNQDCIKSGKDQKVDLGLKNEKETKALSKRFTPSQ